MQLGRVQGTVVATIKNELFEYDNTMMIFGDAKKVLQGLIVVTQASEQQGLLLEGIGIRRVLGALEGLAYLDRLA